MYSLMKARKDYVRLSRTGKRFFFDGFIAQAVPVNDRIGMVGITVTKKLGGSVDRHREKRRLREVIRLWKKEKKILLARSDQPANHPSFCTFTKQRRTWLV